MPTPKPLQDTHPIVRERAAGTIEYIASKEVGARDIVQHGGVPLLVELLEDVAMGVRDAAYAALVEAARFNGVRSALVETQYSLPRLMLLVLKEEHERSIQGLVLLNSCAQVRVQKVCNYSRICYIYKVHCFYINFF